MSILHSCNWSALSTLQTFIFLLEKCPTISPPRNKKFCFNKPSQPTYVWQTLWKKNDAFEDHLEYFQAEQLRLVTPAWCDVTQGFFPSIRWLPSCWCSTSEAVRFCTSTDQVPRHLPLSEVNGWPFWGANLESCPKRYPPKKKLVVGDLTWRTFLKKGMLKNLVFTESVYMFTKYILII